MVLHAFDCRVCWGLHGASIEAGSQHTPSGDSHKNTAAQAPSLLALQLRKMAELLRPCVKSFRMRAPPPPAPGRQHGLRSVALSLRALCDKTPKTPCGQHLKTQTRPFNSEAHGLTMSDLPRRGGLQLSHTLVAQRAPDATEAPERQFSKVTVLSASWEKLPPVLRPPPWGTRQTPKDAVGGSNKFLQRPQPNPKIALKT